MEKQQLYFQHAITYLADDASGYGGQTTLSHIYGCSNQYINQIIKGAKKPSYKTQMKFAEKLNIPLEKILEIGKSRMSGEKGISPLEKKIKSIKDLPLNSDNKTCKNCGSDIYNQKQKRHHQIIDNFNNHQLAVEINQLLVRLEELENDDGLKAALEWAKYRVHEAEKKKNLKETLNGTLGE